MGERSDTSREVRPAPRPVARRRPTRPAAPRDPAARALAAVAALRADGAASAETRVVGALDVLAATSLRLELAAVDAAPRAAASLAFVAQATRALHEILLEARVPSGGSVHGALRRVERFRSWVDARNADGPGDAAFVLALCAALAELLRQLSDV
ncbi:MAG: hypothetical protein JO180_05635 [Gemmatirosa sp.]|nr:hypothetical protein [Gemmatirosa sp.]